jgi:hypothetical protein
VSSSFLLPPFAANPHACIRTRAAAAPSARTRAGPGSRRFTKDKARFQSMLEMISICKKPILSADSRFFQDYELELDADLFPVVWIWDHDKDAIFHHVKVLFAGIRACEPKARQSLDQFSP